MLSYSTKKPPGKKIVLSSGYLLLGTRKEKVSILNDDKVSGIYIRKDGLY